MNITPFSELWSMMFDVVLVSCPTSNSRPSNTDSTSNSRPNLFMNNNSWSRRWWPKHCTSSNCRSPCMDHNFWSASYPWVNHYSWLRCNNHWRSNPRSNDDSWLNRCMNNNSFLLNMNRLIMIMVKRFFAIIGCS